jgi:hypothetical protein
MLRLSRLVLFVSAFALHSASAPAQEKKKPVDVTIPGQIVESDAKDTVRMMPCKVHVLRLEKGNTYLIDMVSRDFDSYLRIEDSAGVQLAQDDDGGGNLNSRIRFAPTKDDAFKIIATTFAGGEGNYTLTVKDINAPIAAVKPPAKAPADKAPADKAPADKAPAVKPPVKEEPKKVEVKTEPKAEPKTEPKAEPKAAQDGAIKLDAPTEKKPVDVKGQLQDGDGIDPSQNHVAKNYVVELSEGVVYKIEMNSTDFDAFLIVRDANGKELAKDDDGGGNLNARILFVPPAKGMYRIAATSFGGGNGNFQLIVRPATEFGKAVKYDPKKVHDGGTSFCIVSTLTNQDAKDAVQQGSPCQIHQVKLAKGKTYIIDLISGQMDCFLRIEDSQKNNLADDDDGGDGLNSRLTFTPDDDGVFRLIATNLDGVTGSYVIAIREQK